MFPQFDLIILATLVIFTISCYRLKLGVFLVCALLPAYLIRTSIFGIPTTMLELAIYAVAGAWLIKSVKRKVQSEKSQFKIKN